ncbi:MAG: DUF1573 domain-containing protein [Planctomycetaceae bacterium]|nr:DUF1573 domain-containing protein [Planctomycetaceae bacterium]
MRTFENIFVSVMLGVFIGAALVQAAFRSSWDVKSETASLVEFDNKVKSITENPNAKIKLYETVYDFGVMDKKEKGTHHFKVENVGTAPLTLEMNATTCSCTGIDISPKRVLPGKTATVTLHWDAEKAFTRFNQGGTVLTNDPANKEIMYTIQGLFVAPALVSPGTLSLNNVTAGYEAVGTVRVYGFENDTLAIERIEWDDKEHFNVTCEQSELNEKDKDDMVNQHAKSVSNVNISLKPGLPLGSFQERITLHTNYPGEPKLEVLVIGKISGDEVVVGGTYFHKDTGILALGKATTGQPLVRDISLTFTGNAVAKASPHIRDVTPKWLNVVISEPRKLGSRLFYSITVTVPANAPASNFSGTDGTVLLIDTGLENTPLLQIPLQLTVAE